jgi:hypothetical protein
MKRAVCAAALLAVAMPAAAQRGPAAAQTHLPADVLALACAPAVAYAAPDSPLRVTGGQDSFTRRNYQPGDLVTINAGAQNGIEVGQTYYVRRLRTANDEKIRPSTPATVITAGWVRVWAVDDTMSLATIEHACDAVEVGDFLEPFSVPVPPTAAVDKPKAERDNYARVMKGGDLRQTFGKGDFFVIARGSNDGVAPGAQFVIYRDKHERDNFLFELGEAVAVDVKPTSSTLKITKSLDAASEGDLVAQRR